VVLTAGAKQKPGQTRLQLLETNVAILRDLVPRILKAAPDALLLMVSNPVDVLTYVAWKLSGLPRERVIGSGTVLDSARFRALLSQRLGIAASNIHAYIVGEHGDSEVAIWSSAHVGNTPLLEFHHSGMERLREEEKEPIFAGVRDAAQHVIAAKGATNWAIGVAVARILEVILRDEHAVLTISSLIQGWNGIDDVCLSLPTLMSARGAGDVLPLGLDSRELAALRHSAQILKDACRSLGF
jgi:L-lactate dehydrogenase